MFKKSQLPSAVTLIRLLIAPVIVYTLLADQYFLSALLLIFAGFSDFFDGYLARKLDSTSSSGAYLDVATDFILIIAVFMVFVIKCWYDPLILILLTMMFLLFIGTSGLKKPVYDPVGKYLGVYLMGMMFVSILFLEPGLRVILLDILIILCLASIISRFQFFLQNSIS
jgi:phosphatidylglycerophosphate synthase